MKRLVPLVLAFILLLSGCGALVPIAEEEDAQPVFTDNEDVSSFGSEDEGFRLTYPSGFTLTSSGDDYYRFTDEENDLSITLSIEENTFSGLSAEEYPGAMDMDMYSRMLSENSFDRDIYAKDESSYYYLYTLTDDNIYCVEYAYNGGENEDSLIDVLNLEVYDDFTGADNRDTLSSYAEAYLEDLFGVGDYSLEPNGTITRRSNEFSSFKAYYGGELKCLIAVNEEGVCFVDETLSGTGYVNIDHLLYEPEPDDNDKAERYARQYCEAVTGVRPEPDGLTPVKGDFSCDGVSLTVYSAEKDGGEIYIGVTSDGAGYVDYTGTGNSFERIEK